MSEMRKTVDQGAVAGWWGLTRLPVLTPEGASGLLPSPNDCEAARDGSGEWDLSKAEVVGGEGEAVGRRVAETDEPAWWAIREEWARRGDGTVAEPLKGFMRDVEKDRGGCAR